MNAAYDDYRRALEAVRDLPAQMAADIDLAKHTQAHAAGLADHAVNSADGAATSARGFVESQLTAARAALEPLGKANLIPPQIRASGIEASATREEVVKTQGALAQAVNHLRRAVQDEIQRTEAESERLARDAAERERRAREAAQRAKEEAERRKRLLRIAAGAAALILVVLIVILAVAL